PAPRRLSRAAPGVRRPAGARAGRSVHPVPSGTPGRRAGSRAALPPCRVEPARAPGPASCRARPRPGQREQLDRLLPEEAAAELVAYRRAYAEHQAAGVELAELREA